MSTSSPVGVSEDFWNAPVGSQPGGERWVPQDIDHIFVRSDGTVYSNVPWEEGGGNVTAFKDGEYLVLLEEDYKAKIVLYRWAPPANGGGSEVWISFFACWESARVLDQDKNRPGPTVSLAEAGRVG